MDVSTDLLDEQMSEERDPDLNDEEDIIIDEIREEHWRDVSQEGKYKKKTHDLRWEIYVKEQEELIYRKNLVSVSHSKGGEII